MKRGEKDAFTGLYERYKSGIYGYCMNLLRDKERASDVMQEIFIKAHRGIPALNRHSTFRPWLFSIARNTLFSTLRKTDESVELDDDNAIENESPLAILTRNDTRDLLGALVQSLKPIYREVIYYREYENLSYEEIAETIGIPETHVKSRLLKARRALVVLFHKNYGRDDVC